MSDIAIGGETEVKRQGEGNLRLLGRFLRYFRSYRGPIILGFFLLVAGLALSLVQPVISMAIIDRALIQKDVHLLNLLGFAFLSAAILSYLIGMYRQYLFAVIQQKIILKVRGELADRVLRLPLSFHTQQNPGYLMSRVDRDVGNLAGVMTDRYVQTLADLLTLLGAGTILVILSWRLALLSLAVLPVFAWSAFYFGKKTRALSWDNQECHAQVAASLQDIFQSTFIIKAFAREAQEVRRLVRRMSRFVRSNLAVTRLGLVSNLTMGVIATMAPLSVIWYGGYQVIHGEITIGMLFAFNMYLAYLFNPLKNLYGTVQSVQASMASLERIFELEDLKREDLRNGEPRAQRSLPGPVPSPSAIRLEEVSFSYEPSREVLSEISFEVAPESTVALVGESGAGKTTIFNLLLGLYRPGGGRILIDGFDSREIGLRRLRTMIRLVPQDACLFNRSLEENVRFGLPEASAEDIRRCCSAAQLDEVIRRLPDGLSSSLGQSGALLSAGERQRVAIARALIADPPILLLDEATSFLDANTEAAVQEALRASRIGRTCLVIAHRLATVLDADEIIVLRSGRVFDRGTHEILYRRCAMYADLCEKQFLAPGLTTSSAAAVC